MAIQIPNPGTGNGATGDNEFVLWTKVKDNFSNTTHAASRLVGTANGQVPLVEQVPSLLGTAATKNVGTAAGNVMEVGAFGWGNNLHGFAVSHVGIYGSSDGLNKAQIVNNNDTPTLGYGKGYGWVVGNSAYSILGRANSDKAPIFTALTDRTTAPGSAERRAAYKDGDFLVMGFNVMKDGNGFYKGASPIAEIYSDKMDLNHDATQQGGITFEKLGVGDYLVKGSLGFAQEGWYIEMPKDANGNVLVAVVYEQLENNDLSIKTYAKKFDDETGDIVANLTRPRDIPDGRFISLRLHELPQELPVMPTETQTEV